jgi:hypothetical protein
MFNNAFGRTTNPYNRSLTCGGSSGGEGALIALGGSPLGVGSDIGGSPSYARHVTTYFSDNISIFQAQFEFQVHFVEYTVSDHRTIVFHTQAPPTRSKAKNPSPLSLGLSQPVSKPPKFLCAPFLQRGPG